MFNAVSLTGSGMIVYVVSLLLKHFGVVIPDDQLAVTVGNVVQVAGMVMMVVGQLRRKDLAVGFFRK